MDKTVLALGLFLISIALAGCQENGAGPVEKQTFNDGWRFLRADEGGSEDQFLLSEFDDSGWEIIGIPHTSRIEPLLVNDQWQGTCWYRKKFKIPPEMKHRKLFLHFEGAMNVADVWVNGIHKIKHQGGYLPFVIEFSN
ncbi:MAG: glycoside hydrolase family 2, partial [Bacteroidota bacterium]|nr:glycoside hydrolase family 2 [Bacteroidota bacterium]